jgi:membrane fusion protein, heavy metal efflux system
MGDTAAKFSSVSGRLDATGRPPSFSAVVAAIDANPQLVRWTAVYAQRNAELLLARLRPYPDVRLSAGWRHFNDTGDDAVRLGISVPIPVFDQNQGNILSAQESLAKTRAEREANRNALIILAGRAYDALQGSLRKLAILRESAIPKSRQAADAIFEGYGQGRFTLLEVLDAQASVAQARLREQEAQQNFHVAVATIEGLVGNSIRTGAGERTMKTSKMIVAGVLAVAIAAVGYRVLTPAKPDAPAAKSEKRDKKTSNEHVEQDEHGADRIRISDVKLAAAGIVLAEASGEMLNDTLQLNGVLRANQESVVQVTPRFPGVVRDIRKRIGDVVSKGEALASVESNQSLTAYDLKAPISGTVIDRQKPAFVVADLSTIWVDLSIYRKDLKRVKIGNEVLIDPDDGAGDIKGTISYVSPVGASDTQTALARVVLANSEGRLRPGLFVTARLVLAKRNVPVAVRVGAIQTLENKTVVFVREGADKLEARPVELGESDPKHVEVKAGLSAGERYVAENSFVVKAEMGKGEADHD